MKNLLIIFLSVLLSCMIFSCAKTGYPSGGERDTIPPKLLWAHPPNFSTNNREPRVTFAFDEFFTINNFQKEMLVSPPLKGNLTYRIKGKKLLIDFPDTLRENTTYIFNFNKSIVDFHESNPLMDFRYVFSTGSFLDSLTVAGKVLNSAVNKPFDEEIMVMLYKDLADSVPLKDKPLYVTRTNKDGSFVFNYIGSAEYRIFALKDVNSNYIYDSPKEMIAFGDSSFVLDASVITAAISDTLIDVGDTLDVVYGFCHNLFLFKEEQGMTYITKNIREKPEQLKCIFNKPMYSSVKISPAHVETDTGWYIEDRGRLYDTVVFWIKDTNIIKSDTVSVIVEYEDKSDTVIFRTRNVLSRKKEKDTANISLKIGLGAAGAVISMRDEPWLLLERPANIINKDKMSLYVMRDTVRMPVSFQTEGDTMAGRRIVLSAQWKEGASCIFSALPGAFTDIYGVSNDTVTYMFSFGKKENYAKLELIFTGEQADVIVQLCDETDKVMRQETLAVPGIVVFDYLQPRDYVPRIIFDVNKNGKWDTGNYLEKRQPEKVLYYNKVINTKANWEIKEQWSLLKE